MTAPDTDADTDARNVVLDMQIWLERAVIGLNLCPFAKAVHVRGQVHYAVSDARTAQALEPELAQEMEALAASDPVLRDTTLLVVPGCLSDFFEFNLFLADTARILKRLRLDGVIQIASFHPDFQFANTSPDDITNYTNRAPYPTLHLLRESSIDRAVQAFPDAAKIYGNNIQMLERLGHAGWDKLGVHRTQLNPKEKDA